MRLSYFRDLKNIILIISIVSSIICDGYSQSPAENKEILFQRFIMLYDSGDLLKAEKALLLFLESKDPLTIDQLAAGYNNLGVVNLTLGNYEKALEYNLKAETFISKKDHLKHSQISLITEVTFIILKSHLIFRLRI